MAKCFQQICQPTIYEMLYRSCMYMLLLRHFYVLLMDKVKTFVNTCLSSRQLKRNTSAIYNEGNFKRKQDMNSHAVQ